MLNLIIMFILKPFAFANGFLYKIISIKVDFITLKKTYETNHLQLY